MEVGRRDGTEVGPTTVTRKFTETVNGSSRGENKGDRVREGLV